MKSFCEICLMKITLSRSLQILSLVLLASSCAKQTLVKERVTYEQNTFINENLEEDAEMKAFIAPYKLKLDQELDRVISYTPIDLYKNGFNSPLANLNCDLILEEANSNFGPVDMCLLNHGGIRRTFTKGDLTVKNIYEWMPFENQAVVVTLSGEKVLEMMKFLADSSKGHPIAGFKFNPNDMNTLEIQGQKFDVNKTYTVVTNDYLQKGGDEMYFFANPVKLDEKNVKLRDMMLNYFEKHDTIKVKTDKRILK